MAKIRIAVIGAGEFGQHHARVLHELPEAELVAVVDTDAARAREVGGRFGAEAIGDYRELVGRVDAAAAVARLPLFFEVHRMSVFTPRSLDIDVVLDLMIHDIDIVLSLVESPLQQVQAVGLPVLSPRADIAHVRLQFENGCVANLTASRVSTERIRKLRFFQPRQYVSVDYARQDGAVFAVGASKHIEMRPLEIARAEPLAREMAAFLECVEKRAVPRVSGEEGRKALAVALKIVSEMEAHARIVGATLARQGK